MGGGRRDGQREVSARPVVPVDKNKIRLTRGDGGGQARSDGGSSIDRARGSIVVARKLASTTGPAAHVKHGVERRTGTAGLDRRGTRSTGRPLIDLFRRRARSAASAALRACAARRPTERAASSRNHRRGVTRIRWRWWWRRLSPAACKCYGRLRHVVAFVQLGEAAKRIDRDSQQVVPVGYSGDVEILTPEVRRVDICAAGADSLETATVLRMRADAVHKAEALFVADDHSLAIGVQQLITRVVIVMGMIVALRRAANEVGIATDRQTGW